MDKILQEQHDRQQTDSPAKVIKVVVPVVDNHAREHEQYHHLDEHNRDIEKRILAVLIRKYSLQHPCIDEHKKCDKESQKGIATHDSVMQMVNQPGCLGYGIYEHQIIEQLGKFDIFVLDSGF